MELIEKLGIDWRLLIAQIINFFILLFVLYRFAYKPIIRVLHKRTETIEKSLSDAKKIEQNLAESEKKQSEILTRSRLEAKKILDDTNQQAEVLRQSRLKETNQEIEKLKQTAQEDILQAKDKMLKEVKSEVADLVVLTTEKIIEQKIDEKTNRRLIEQALTELTHQKK